MEKIMEFFPVTDPTLTPVPFLEGKLQL